MAYEIPGPEEIDAMTDSEYKVLENRCRRAAQRRGLVLQKSRVRDPQARNYRRYRLTDATTRRQVTGDPNMDHGLTLAEVARYLLDSARPVPIHVNTKPGHESLDFNETNGEPILFYRTPTAHQVVSQQRLRRGLQVEGKLGDGWVLSYVTEGGDIDEHVTGITDLAKAEEAVEAAQEHLTSIGYRVGGVPEVASDGSTDPYDQARLQIIEFLNDFPKILNFRLPATQDGSRMAGDVAATTDLNIWHLCSHYFGASVDYLRGLYQLLRPEPLTLLLPRYAAYPLIRGVIEASGQIVWVLGPEDRRVRFLRLLQLQKDELDYDGKYIDTRTELHDDDPAEVRSVISAFRENIAYAKRARWGQLLGAATALGIDQGEFERGLGPVGGYSSLIREAVAEQGLDRAWQGREGAGIWVFISGLSHPSYSRQFAGSINRPVEVNGEFRWWSEANPNVIRDSMNLALNLHHSAAVLWKKAGSAPGDDL
jgi:hypothetical protein